MKAIDAFNLIHPVSEDLQPILVDCIKTRKVKKGTLLLNFGQVDRHVHYVQSGSGRVFYFKKEKDITDYIALDGQFLGGVSSVFTALPSDKAIEITEDSIIESMPISQLEALSKQHHDIETLYRKMMIWAFLECQQRIEDLRFLSSGERYEALHRKYPGISNRIPLKHLASYLGTTQVSLSRIRAGIQ